jgi:hypothetical protein
MKYKLGYYSGKAALVLAVYAVFCFAELNINVLEWTALSRLIFVALSIGLFFNHKPTR